MFGLRDYFRRITATGVLAGVHDAIAALEGRRGETLTSEQAAKALLDLFAGVQGDAPTGGPPPEQLRGAETAGPAALTEPPRRGPGRPPRKFQEPPGS